jgi:SP family arabinose:H+ symporter-like MFS transporter
MRLNYYLAKGSLVGALGGFLFGFDTAVISGTTQQLSQVYRLSSFNLGVTVSIAVIGAVIGAMSSGELGQKIGPRQALRVMALLYLLSSLGCAFAWSWPALVVFRFLGGLGIGGSSVLGPVYIAELAPAKWRGRLVGLFQINIVVGILIAYASNYVIAIVKSGPTEWRWQLGIAAIPAGLFLALLYSIPRSSRWLVTQSRIDEARKVLQMMGSPNSEEELQEIIASIHLERSSKKEPLFQRKYRLPIFLAVTIGLFNQLSGINAILYYLPSIFNSAGFSKLSGEKQAVLVGAMNLIATLLAMSVIDKLGRKTLLLIGSVGTTISLAGVAAIFYTQRNESMLLWYLIGFIFFFGISQGSVIWVYLSEVFPTKVRSKGQSLGSSSHWVMNAALSLLFPIVAQHSKATPFVFFAAMMALQFFVVLFVYPETKGITLEQMQHKLGIE